MGYKIKMGSSERGTLIKKPFTIKPYPMKNHTLDGFYKRKVASVLKFLPAGVKIFYKLGIILTFVNSITKEF
jgi:hypothetical protein